MAELRQAFRRRAFAEHPDHHDAAAADEEMAAINEAWRVLRDPKQRAAYDRSLGNGTGSSPSPTPAAAPPPGPASAPAPDPIDADDRPITRSDVWVRRWVIGVGFLVLLAAAFAAMLLWIALGGDT